MFSLPRSHTLKAGNHWSSHLPALPTSSNILSASFTLPLPHQPLCCSCMCQAHSCLWAFTRAVHHQPLSPRLRDGWWGFKCPHPLCPPSAPVPTRPHGPVHCPSLSLERLLLEGRDVICLVCHHIPSAGNMPGREVEASRNRHLMIGWMTALGSGRSYSLQLSACCFGSYLFFIWKLEGKSPPRCHQP